MKSKMRARPMMLVATAAVLGTIVASAAPAPAPPATPAPLATPVAADPDQPLCCVANPRYAGICAVELGEDETCQDVLDYLNNAASAGKTYCGGTSVRMGWEQVECQDEES